MTTSGGTESVARRHFEARTGALQGIRDTSYGFVKRIDFIAEELEREAESVGRALSVLDVGCGTGQLLAAPMAQICSFVRITGVDVHEESIAWAAETYSSIPNLRFEVRDLATLPDDAFDVVICSEVLEHVIEYGLFLDLLKKKTRPTGMLIITVPNGWGPYEVQSFIYRRAFEETPLYGILKKLLRRGGTEEPRAFLNRESRHVNFFTMSRVRRLFSAHQLDLLRYEGRTFLAGPFIDIFLRLPVIERLNGWAGSRLPPAVVSGWMFVLRRPA